MRAGLQKSVILKVARNKRAAQQFIEREGETATLFGTSPVTFYVVAGRFVAQQSSWLNFRRIVNVI